MMFSLVDLRYRRALPCLARLLRRCCVALRLLVVGIVDVFGRIGIVGMVGMVGMVGVLVLAQDCAAHDNDDLIVSVSVSGGLVSVRAEFAVAVSASTAFAVLTDYDHMEDFLPDVTHSRVLQRSANTLVVSQSVRMRMGFLSMPVDSVRQVDLERRTS